MNNVDLFNNSFVQQAEKSMSCEQKEKYKIIGEELYNTVDFVNAEGKKETVPEHMLNAIAYILDSIRSGQHISMLESNEKHLLFETYGKNWFTVFGYTKEDVDNLVTFPSFGGV